ncbi:MAG TPA: sensor domain-containing diguanylate cyclase [Micromonosporaceae bacterium]
MTRALAVGDACQLALDSLSDYTDAMTAVVLRIQDHLRSVAASGSWQVFSNLPIGSGVIGRVYATGLTAVITDVAADPDYISLGPPVEVVICLPIVDQAGKTIGALNVEFVAAVDAEAWQNVLEVIAEQIGRRIVELSGAPVESSNEKLIRHGLILTTAATESELAAYSLHAARDVSGLSSAVLILATADGYEVIIDEANPTPLERRLAAVSIDDVVVLVQRAHNHGASYSLGDPTHYHSAGFEALTSIGVRTLIAIPVGAHSPVGGVLLLADEVAMRPDPETIALIGLLAAQAWSSRERIRTLAHLHERALSDPLTGLRHQGSFGERLAGSIPGRTAVFAIDIDGFKSINDTYGHQAGDRALVALAQALSTALRTQDELYRIGGDEFAAIVELQKPDEALNIADRLVVAARAVGHTISVGVAIRRAGELASDTLSRADSALYVAKRNGRDGARLSP